MEDIVGGIRSALVGWYLKGMLLDELFTVSENCLSRRPVGSFQGQQGTRCQSPRKENTWFM